MSVGLFIETKSGTVTRPVATESLFLNVWLPKAEAESFTLIEQLGLGLSVDESNLPELLVELGALTQKIPTYSDVADDVKGAWLERLYLLSSTLEECQSKDYTSIYIG